MIGLCFSDIDDGHGGPDGFLSHHQKWCVKIDGRKHHIETSLTGSHHPRDPVKRSVVVKPCDGSCGELKEIDADIVRKAFPLIEQDDRPLSTTERSSLPAEIADANYLAEVVAAYKRQLAELETKNKKLKAAQRLAWALETSWLGRFFRALLADYDTADKQK